MTWHGVETSNQKKIKDTDLIVNTTPPGVSSNAGLDSRSLHPLAGRRSYLSSLGPFSSRKLDYRKISRSISQSMFIQLLQPKEALALLHPYSK